MEQSLRIETLRRRLIAEGYDFTRRVIAREGDLRSVVIATEHINDILRSYLGGVSAEKHSTNELADKYVADCRWEMSSVYITRAHL